MNKQKNQETQFFAIWRRVEKSTVGLKNPGSKIVNNACTIYMYMVYFHGVQRLNKNISHIWRQTCSWVNWRKPTRAWGKPARARGKAARAWGKPARAWGKTARAWRGRPPHLVSYPRCFITAHTLIGVLLFLILNYPKTLCAPPTPDNIDWHDQNQTHKHLSQTHHTWLCCMRQLLTYLHTLLMHEKTSDRLPHMNYAKYTKWLHKCGLCVICDWISFSPQHATWRGRLNRNMLLNFL